MPPPLVSVCKNFTYDTTSPGDQQYDSLVKQRASQGNDLVPKICPYQQMNWNIYNDGEPPSFISFMVANTWWNMALYEVFHSNENIHMTVKVDKTTHMIRIGIEVLALDKRMEQIVFLLTMSKINENISDATDTTTLTTSATTSVPTTNTISLVDPTVVSDISDISDISDTMVSDWGSYIKHYENSGTTMDFTPSFQIGSLWIDLEYATCSIAKPEKVYNVRLDKGWHMVCDYDEMSSSFEESSASMLIDNLVNRAEVTVLLYQSGTPLETILTMYSKLHTGATISVNSKRKKNIKVQQCGLVAFDTCHFEHIVSSGVLNQCSRIVCASDVDPNVFTNLTTYDESISTVSSQSMSSQSVSSQSVSSQSMSSQSMSNVTSDPTRWVLLCNQHGVDKQSMYQHMKWQKMDKRVLDICKGDRTTILENYIYDKITKSITKQNQVNKIQSSGQTLP